MLFREATLRACSSIRVSVAEMDTEPVSDDCQEDHMEKDVVCGMQVDPTKAAGSSQYNGKMYYFCSPGCKAKFDADPDRFLK